MTQERFNTRLANLPQCIVTKDVEKITYGVPAGCNVFTYAAVCEKLFEHQLSEMTGRERISTFYADLSIGEWCGLSGVIDTCRNACKYWRDSVEMMSEFALCVNWKAWEHASRNNDGWAQAYSELYYYIDDMLRDYYESEPDKAAYYFNYMD